MMMAPVTSPSPAPQAASSGQTVASAATRVAPVPQSPSLAAVVSGAQTAGALSSAGLPQSISAQALLTLLQTLGKPLSGTVGQGTAGQSTPGQVGQGHGAHGQAVSTGNSASTGLPLTLSVPRGGTGASPGTIATTLPLPAGSTAPAPGTSVLVQAEGGQGSPRIGVTVLAEPATSASNLRADAARQSSLAPLLADVARLAGQSGSVKGLDAALGRIMGFALNADAPPDAATLKNALEGARSGAPMPVGASGSAGAAAQASLPAAPMQTALGALIRALGLAMPDAGAAAHSANTPQGQSTPPSAAGAGSKAGHHAQAQQPTPPPVPNGSEPSRLLAHPLPPDAPDLSDPNVLQALKTKAEAALSRFNLLQGGSDGLQQRAGDAAPALRWDVPFLIGQEAAVLGVAIDHDGGQDASEDGREVSWRFRFAFESQALGGVEGLVALHQLPSHREGDPHLDIAVWASEPGVLERLDSSRVDLVERLQALGLVVDSLTLAPTEDMPHTDVPSDHETLHRVDVSS